ncbi:hypothetical protein Drose_20895 [Dactylosporangium roseum]|uniref:Uncharacterized protein n=1 Tax=Dactylosporangium roseum TaxID=47989 RepID=A0ABY5YVJ6_9ACTN|nr:hypothetical protein [Dactylosporangium roseum]UWZ33744.1 hypothetical protein Drose_20895 [Dactylosporangium roseum]
MLVDGYPATALVGGAVGVDADGRGSPSVARLPPSTSAAPPMANRRSPDIPGIDRI